MSLLVLPSFTTSSSASAPPPPPPSTTFSSTNFIVLMYGESNAGGRGINYEALSSEIGDRPSVKILNNTTRTSFDTLHISNTDDPLDNTHVGHLGAAHWGAFHGWELEMANEIAAGNFGPNPGYLVKAGQGGARIVNLIPGGSFTGDGITASPWTMLNDRLDAAISLRQAATGATPSLYMFYTQGINDCAGGIDATTWKNNTLTLFNAIRDKYGMVPIVMTYLPPSYASYNPYIDSICATLPYCYAIQTDDAAMNASPDSDHWSYAGQKLVCSRMITKIKTLWA